MEDALQQMAAQLREQSAAIGQMQNERNAMMIEMQNLRARAAPAAAPPPAVSVIGTKVLGRPDHIAGDAGKFPIGASRCARISERWTRATKSSSA